MAKAKPRASSPTGAPDAQSRKWSRHVMQTSNALDLEDGAFKGTPREIAESLKRSADRSKRRKAAPFRSAMSMLNFYVNRGGKNLSPTARARLERAKDELRALYGRPTSRRATARAPRGRRR